MLTVVATQNKKWVIIDPDAVLFEHTGGTIRVLAENAMQQKGLYKQTVAGSEWQVGQYMEQKLHAALRVLVGFADLEDDFELSRAILLQA